MKLFKMTLASSLALAALIHSAGFAATVPASRLSFESPQVNATLEKRAQFWLLTSQTKASKEIVSTKISEAADVARTETTFDEIRDWVIETAPSLKVQAGCRDINVKVVGAFSKSLALCSKVAAHRIFAERFRTRLISVTR